MNIQHDNKTKVIKGTSYYSLDSTNSTGYYFYLGGSDETFPTFRITLAVEKENPDMVTISAVFDLLAGFGLVLPMLLRIQPKLTVYAAYGTIALMISASVFHIMRGEGSQIGFNIFMLVSAIFIAWGRQTKASVQPKD